MTAEYVALHASERPHAVALINNGRAITYAEFDRDLRRFTAAVGALGLPRGRTAAIGCADLYVHWLLLLACERLGIGTFSVIAPKSEESLPLPGIDLALAEPHFNIAGSTPRHHVTPDWIERARSRPDEPAAIQSPGDPDDPLRILSTSGTTGTSKRVLVTRRHHETRVAQNAFKYRLSERSRYLVTMPFTVGVVYSCVTACLRLGALVIAGAFNDPVTMAEALNAHAITHVTLLPFQLHLLLDSLPRDFEKPRGLTIFALGAAVSEVLRKTALERLATELCSGYGCNEVGIISFTSLGSPDQIESICPGVVVEVLDERGRALPPGEVGEIRVRTPCMAEGYIGDPETSRRMFRDGWFYPGDVGVLHDGRRLQVIGRLDEILNIGGAKVSPEALEELILARSPIRDVSVCSIRNAAGIEEVCVAVTGAAGGDREIVDWITQAFRGLQIGTFRVTRLPFIPRTAAGKIQREVLKRDLMAAIDRVAPSR